MLQRPVLVVGALLAIAFLWAAGAFDRLAPRLPPDAPLASVITPQPVVPTSWQQLKRWTGSGMKETETFTTSSREWRITWAAGNEVFAGAGLLQIFVHDGGGNMITLVANKQGTGQDTSYVRSPPGPHYLMINSGNVDWVIEVEDQR